MYFNQTISDKLKNKKEIVPKKESEYNKCIDIQLTL